MTDILVKREETQRWEGRDGHVTVEAETGVNAATAKKHQDCQKPEETRIPL